MISMLASSRRMGQAAFRPPVAAKASSPAVPATLAHVAATGLVGPISEPEKPR